MKTGRNRVKPEMKPRQLLALAIALLLCASASLAVAESAPMLSDVDLIMAQNAVMAYGIKGADGQLITPRKEPELYGRGEPDAEGNEPDYRGVVGFMALQTTWDVTKFNTFTQTPWMLPVYMPDGDNWKITDTIRHKTPVLVVDQKLNEEKGHKYRGYLQVVRLDNHREVWIDVKQFTTAAYWTMELKDAIQYGYCIAVYRNNSRYEPMDKKGHRGTLPEGLRVLMIDQRSYRFYSKDKEHNLLQGIVFRSKEEGQSFYRTFLFFNADDLKLVY